MFQLRFCKIIFTETINIKEMIHMIEDNKTIYTNLLYLYVSVIFTEFLSNISHRKIIIKKMTDMLDSENFYTETYMCHKINTALV